MIKQITLAIIEAIKQSGGASVFWGGLIEQIISPIPSVLIPMSAGFILIPQGIDFLTAASQILSQIAIPYSLGATLGTTVLYLAAFFGGRALIQKFGKFFGLSLKHIDRFQKKFTRGFRDELIIFLLIALPATPISLVAASCGLIGIKAYEFYPVMFAGTFVRSAFLGWLGWQTGEAYQTASHSLNRVESLLTLIAALSAFALVAFLYYKRHKLLKD